jgi:hypothetical protein
MTNDDPGGEPIRLDTPEIRWPILAAVLVVMTLTVLRPPEIRVAPQWVLPAIEAVLLLALLADDPAKVGRRPAVLRAISIGVVVLVLLDTLTSAVAMIAVLIQGGKLTNSATQLMAAGATVWGCNVLAFALLYWLMDGGGPGRRSQPRSAPLDLAFPQHLNPEVAAPGWRPHFVDYLYLGLTSSTAFSPTDVMPLTPWVKIGMGVQSLISLALFALVIARAVNAFT